LFPQGVGLLFQAGLQGALGQARGGSTGDLLHGIQIDTESRSVVAKGASGDDFAPTGGEVTKFLEFLGGEGTSCHVASCLEVETMTPKQLVPG
jgi:hypothetical protein